MGAPLEPAVLRPGFRLDRYELLCPLAYGGMAAVWLARFGGKLGFEKLVVVKTILPQYAAEPEFQKMFVDEARIAAAIDHGNVARILDVGEQHDVLYIVMEWIDGESLSRLKRAAEKHATRIPAGILLRILADACAGLHAAHELCDKSGHNLGVVHRDISPQNILLSAQGTAKVIDFGVAKARDRSSANTSAGQLKGKIRYMSPEQALGREVDRRADLWSVGALAYELFAGAPPYDGPNEIATLHRLTSGARPAPLTDVPPQIAAVIDCALSHDPARRFATAAEMQAALEHAMSELRLMTTAGHVSAFMAQYMGDRAEGRKRTVENARAAAAAREQHGSDASSTEHRYPEPSADPNPLAEPPSHTSTATLGSAAVEWPGPDAAPGRRRVSGLALAGALLGLGIVAAGGFGIHRIVSAAGGEHAAAHVDAPVAPAPPPLDVASVIPEPVAVPAATAKATATPIASAAAEPPAARPAKERARGAAPTAPKLAPSGSAAPKKRDYGF